MPFNEQGAREQLALEARERNAWKWEVESRQRDLDSVRPRIAELLLGLRGSALIAALIPLCALDATARSLAADLLGQLAASETGTRARADGHGTDQLALWLVRAADSEYLLWAIDSNNQPLVKQLLSMGADPNFAAGNVRGGESALHRAMDSGHAALVRDLLRKGANPGARDSQGRTPLHAAASRDWPEGAKLFLDHCRRAVAPAYPAVVSSSDHKGRTPLHAAATNDSAEFAKLLLDHSAAVSDLDHEGRTPLHAAAERGSVKVTTVLLDHRADVNALDHQGRTPLHAAAARGSVEVVQSLLDHGAAVNARDQRGLRPLCLAEDAYHRAAAVLLRSRGGRRWRWIW